MSKLNWSRHQVVSKMDRDYYNSPVTGFDNKWHTKRKHILTKEINLGKHEKHNWQVIKLDSGPHTGKVICNDCNGKFVTWLPKGSI